MKATLHRASSPTTIPARLPPLFRPLIDHPKRFGASSVTLAAFPATFRRRRFHRRGAAVAGPAR